MNRYLMKEVVYSTSGNYFSIPPGLLKGKEIRIETFPDRMTASYGIESSLSPEDIFKSRLPVSQLVHGIFGNGFQNYDSQLLSVADNTMSLVGLVRSRVPHLNGCPLLLTPQECVYLLGAVLGAQLEHKSVLVDGLVAAMSQANMGGFVESTFAWAWWGLEWLIRSLDEMKPVQGKFDYMATGPQREDRNIRELFKGEVKSMVSSFRDQILGDYRFSGVQADRFKSEVNGILEQVNDSLLRPTFMEMFDNQLPFLRDTVDAFLREVKNWPSEVHARGLFGDWATIRDKLIRPSLEARNKGFHFGRHAGILEGERFDVYHGMKRFVSWVCCLMAILLTARPDAYDPRCGEDARRLCLAPLPAIEMPVEQLSIPSHGVLEWYDYDQGKVVKRSTPVSGAVLKEDYVIGFSPQLLERVSRGSCLVEQKRPFSADYTMTTDRVVASGELLGLDRLWVHNLIVRPVSS